jgi:predicted nucleotidyltransferase
MMLNLILPEKISMENIMNALPSINPTLSSTNPDVLSKFRNALNALYGSRIERVMLFGSRARGDALPDSDYDVAVFLKEPIDRWREIETIIPIIMDILDDTGAVINALPFRAGAYVERTPLMHEIRAEGVDI